MFYIGFRDEQHAQIGVARSRDGLTHWQRHLANPIIRPGAGRWDHDAVYKPFALVEAETAGCSGTMVAMAQMSKSGSLSIRVMTWDSPPLEQRPYLFLCNDFKDG